MLGWLGAARAGEARVLVSFDEALELVFEDAEVERQTLYLTEAELARAGELAARTVESALVTRYVATGSEGQVLARAYSDTHVVRTLPETLMIVLEPDGSVRRIEVLSFKEPPDYLPRPAWYAQFVGLELSDELALTGAIRPISGATLTGRATLEAVRRVLAVDRVLAARSAPAEPAGAPASAP